jgi:hypothetical protein
MIAADTLARVTAQVAELGGLSEPAVAALRQAWPDIHFTWCSEDDVPAQLQPASAGDGFAIYLVSGAQHCVGFTNHLEAATGLVLATTSDE